MGAALSDLLVDRYSRCEGLRNDKGDYIIATWHNQRGLELNGVIDGLGASAGPGIPVDWNENLAECAKQGWRAMSVEELVDRFGLERRFQGCVFAQAAVPPN